MKKQFKKEIIEKGEYCSLVSSIGALLEDSRKTVYFIVIARQLAAGKTANFK